ncbi:MAG: beta-galactosidase [Pseudomonadota bacterium]
MKPALGVCYYPEQWPRSFWEEDAARMIAAGLSYVRIGEFAWSRLEPQPGVFDWRWLDDAVEVLANAGLKIIMGTPSATPPRWMLDRFPDMLAVDADGRPRGFGSRRHYCFSHAGYRDAAAEFARRMTARYCQHPAVTHWQIDNEYGCHDTVLSYSDAARGAFQAWCTDRYGEIEALNTAWGNVFWSMDYQSFDQIGLPNLTVTEPNPSHVMAFRRFSSDQVVAWNKAQAEAVRSETQAPLIHNYMGRILEFDHFATSADLDIASWDSYPIGFLSDRLEASAAHKAGFLRQGDPDFQAFHHDLYRAVGRGRWWVMEQQPGPVNWAPFNPAPLPGMVRLWSHEAFAHGAEVVSYFRWRQAPFGQEQYHAALLRPDSADAPGLTEAKTVAEELAVMPPLDPEPAPVAIVFDYTSAWAWDTEPQGASFDYFALVFEVYRALRKLGLSVDFLPSDAETLSPYKLVLVPGLMTLSPTLRSAIAAHDGLTLLGPRSNAKTPEMAIPVPLPPDLPDLDITISFVESLPPDCSHALRGGGNLLHWFEHLEGNAPVLESLADGRPILMGNDNVAYLGGWLDPAGLAQILTRFTAAQGIPIHAMPGELRRRDAGALEFLINYGADPIVWEDITVEGCGVHWRDRPAS